MNRRTNQPTNRRALGGTASDSGFSAVFDECSCPSLNAKRGRSRSVRRFICSSVHRLFLFLLFAGLPACVTQPTSMQSELFQRIETERPQGVSREEFVSWNIRRVFNLFDRENRGYITLEDWRYRRGKGSAHEFRRLDRNRDGRIILAEVTSNPLVRDHMRALFAEIDSNHNGVIDRREIAAYQAGADTFLP